jgi:hypothetical protein
MMSTAITDDRRSVGNTILSQVLVQQESRAIEGGHQSTEAKETKEPNYSEPR